MTGTTIESTSLDDQNRARRLPPDLLRRTNALLDELVSLRASKPDDAYARQCRTNRLEDLIGNAAESIRAKLEQQHQTFRISAVLDHMWIKRDLYGITRLPTRQVVQRVLVKHGLYVIGS
ncbi:hypothetical protein D3C77_478560 [compost metagenome]